MGCGRVPLPPASASAPAAAASAAGRRRRRTNDDDDARALLTAPRPSRPPPQAFRLRRGGVALGAHRRDALRGLRALGHRRRARWLLALRGVPSRAASAAAAAAAATAAAARGVAAPAAAAGLAICAAADAGASNARLEAAGWRALQAGAGTSHRAAADAAVWATAAPRFRLDLCRRADGAGARCLPDAAAPPRADAAARHDREHAPADGGRRPKAAQGHGARGARAARAPARGAGQRRRRCLHIVRGWPCNASGRPKPGQLCRHVGLDHVGREHPHHAGVARALLALHCRVRRAAAGAAAHCARRHPYRRRGARYRGVRARAGARRASRGHLCRHRHCRQRRGPRQRAALLPGAHAIALARSL